MKNNTRCTGNFKILGGLFLSMLLLFVAIASAEETDGTQTEIPIASAGAQAIAVGSEAIVSSHVAITSDGASASAIAKAKAENGETATAIAEAWANWIDGSSASARSVATAIAGIGETIWAEAKTRASVSKGEASTETEAYIGTDPNHIDHPDHIGGDPDHIGGDPKDTDNSMVTQRPDAIGGFIFGKGDIERYCNFKLQSADEDHSNDYRAKYFMNIIAWDYGFKDEKLFEDKYNIICTSGLDMKDRFP